MKQYVRIHSTSRDVLASQLIFHHIFFNKFGDPSFLQTSASSDLSEFGMTGYFVGHWRKKRRFAATFYSCISVANRRFFLLLINYIPVIPSASEGSPSLFQQVT